MGYLIHLIVLFVVPNVLISCDDSPTTSHSLLYFDNDRAPVDLLEESSILEESAPVTRSPEIALSSITDQQLHVSSTTPETSSSTELPSPSTEASSTTKRVLPSRWTVKPRIPTVAPIVTQAPTFPPPLAKDPIGIKFYLFTRFHSHSPYVLDPNSAESLKGAYFTFSYQPNIAKKSQHQNKKLYILVHGLNDGVDVTTWMKTAKSRLLDTDRDANVVLIDWSRGAAVNLLNDLRFASVRIVGQQTVQLIKGLEFLYPETFSGDNVHIIAHSFGTFAADVVGRNVEGLGRITGLDPAGGVSNIAQMPPSQRLDPSDAKFVDVIHTDAPKPADAPLALNPSSMPSIVIPGSSLLRAPAAAAAAASASGTMIPLGHFDFYPNGGYTQPGCNALSTSPAASILRPLLPAVSMGASQNAANNLKKLLSCSHSRAIDLFIESIKSRDAPGCSLVSYSCSNYTNFLEAKCTLCREGSEQGSETCALMGLHSIDAFDPTTHKENKKFYVTTNSRGPYCLYHYGVAVKIAKKPKNANRGGVLLVNLEAEYVSASQEPNLEVKLVGGLSGFKAGKTVRAIFTHFADIGAVKNAVVSWVPAPPNLAVLLSPSTSPSVFIQALKVYPMSFAEPQTRKAISRALCPQPSPLAGFLGESHANRGEAPVAALSAFFKEVTFTPSKCTHYNQNQHHFRDVDGTIQSFDSDDVEIDEEIISNHSNNTGEVMTE